MSSPPSTNEAPTRQMKESDWRGLISAVRSGNLVPMVGTDLMRVEVEGRSVNYDHVIAEELAKGHGITDAELVALGTSVSEAALNDVVSVCIKRDGDRSRWDLHNEHNDVCLLYTSRCV